MPAEWEPHERCIIAWPGADLVSTRLVTAAKTDYALVAKAISDFEPVLVVARPGFGPEAAAYCGPGVDVVELPLGEAWLRDSGPIFARRTAATSSPSTSSSTAGERRCRRPRTKRRSGRAWPSGSGSSASPSRSCSKAVPSATDGEGTLIAVETTILDERRNPGVSRAACEAAFREFLGIERTIWLEHGLLEDRTGGHVDNVAAFVAPGRVLCQTVTDRDDPNHARLEANRAALEAAVDARGRRLEVVELDVLPYRQWAGRRLALPYLNFYVGNGCVIVPLACLPCDQEGLAQVQSVFPDREVVGVPATNLARRGGGAHCITLAAARLSAIPVRISRTIRSATSAVMSAEPTASGSPRRRRRRRARAARRPRGPP